MFLNDYFKSMPDWQRQGFATGGAGLAGGLASTFLEGGYNPSKEANKFYNQIPDQLHEAYDPWVQYGQQLTQHPGERLNEIGAGYQQSPGYKFALQQALQAGQHASNAGGMGGSPQNQQQQMQLASNIASQDYNQWLQNALGLHNTGYGYGQQAGMNLGEGLASNLASQGNMAYSSTMGQNAANAQDWGQIFGGAASLIPFLF